MLRCVVCSVLVEYHMYIINNTDVFYWSDTGERLNNDCVSSYFKWPNQWGATSR